MVVGTLLSREAPDRPDDLVGDEPADLRGAHTDVEAGAMQRSAELHGDAVVTGQSPADRLESVSTGQRHGHHRGSRREGEPRDTGPPAVEPAVERAGSLGMDTEGSALAQDAFSRLKVIDRTDALNHPRTGHPIGPGTSLTQKPAAFCQGRSGP